MDIYSLIEKVAPTYESVLIEINELKVAHPRLSKKKLTKIYTDRIRRNYTSIGVSTALPSVIPGLGTGAQILIEAGSVSGDLLLMLRWMSSICLGTGIIYEKDMTQSFNSDMIKVLGIWCGVIIGVKEFTKRMMAKAAIVQFNRKVSGKVLQQINRRVGTTILTKYGTKRGGIAIGRLIPFGVGAIVGGSFNYYTMSKFSKSAMKYYGELYDCDFSMVN